MENPPRLLNDIETQAQESVRGSFSGGPVNLTPLLQRIATYAFKYNEADPDTQWLVYQDPMLSPLLVESGLWSEY